MHSSQKLLRLVCLLVCLLVSIGWLLCVSKVFYFIPGWWCVEYRSFSFVSAKWLPAKKFALPFFVNKKKKKRRKKKEEDYPPPFVTQCSSVLEVYCLHMTYFYIYYTSRSMCDLIVSG